MCPIVRVVTATPNFSGCYKDQRKCAMSAQPRAYYIAGAQEIKIITIKAVYQTKITHMQLLPNVRIDLMQISCTY